MVEVVVAEDHALVRRSVLGVRGHRVFCATSPYEAVVMAISHVSGIDLLSSD